MTAATADRSTTYSLADLLAIPVEAATRIWAGTMVCVNAAGYAVPAADAVGNQFEGVAEAQADNRLGAAGAISVVVRRKGRFRFAAETAVDQTAMGACVYVHDDQTVEADAALETADILVGRIARIVSANVVDVDLMPACRAWSQPTTTTTAAPAGLTTTGDGRTTTAAAPGTTTTTSAL